MRAAAQPTAMAVSARRCPRVRLYDTVNQLLLVCGGDSISVTDDTLGTGIGRRMNVADRPGAGQERSRSPGEGREDRQ
ncbi:hypothetical protein CVO76_16230 [Arthrobacter agilis]|uniref:Uncharacterized protein n=1 Tax=Arthrobacter agilis TaxID=37921 RepID=A0A2L0UIF0_9MICC|nr:hypothetical protein CVO76_16230 [Arthrobacter agilis]